MWDSWNNSGDDSNIQTAADQTMEWTKPSNMQLTKP